MDSFTGSYRERQKQWIELHGLKVGSKVKIVKGYRNGEDGFDRQGCSDTSTLETKGSFIGKTVVIVCIGNGVQLKCSMWPYTFPYFALEPVA